MVDASLHNFWQIAKLQGNPISQLEFRRDVALSYLTRYQQLPKSAGRKPKARPSTLEKRYDGTNHLVRPTEKKRRCANCPSIMRTECSKCNVGLCVKCFLFTTRSELRCRVLIYSSWLKNNLHLFPNKGP